jgi:hypothetical protein
MRYFYNLHSGMYIILVCILYILVSNYKNNKKIVRYFYTNKTVRQAEQTILDYYDLKYLNCIYTKNTKKV